MRPLIILILCSIAHFSYSQVSSCCSATSIRQMADLSKDLTFVIAHEEPLPFVLENGSGKTIQFKTADSLDGQGYYIQGAKSSNVWIFVFHEWWGLNDYVKNEAEKLHTTFPKAHILCLDMYDGKIATKREEAGSLMQNAKEERLANIVNGAGQFAGKDAKIGTIGWCFGGAWSNKATIQLGSKMFGSVIYYGMPVLNEEQLSKITCPTLGIFAEQDGWITPAVAKEFEEKLRSKGKEVQNHIYPAAHAFANPSNPKYDQFNAMDAWDKTIQFFTRVYPK